MPYKFQTDKILLPKEFDRRIKLKDCQKKAIVKLYKESSVSQRKLARMFEVSRRLISFILFPERLDRAKQLLKERRKDGRYYDKDSHTKAIRNHRQYKQKVMKGVYDD